MADDSGDGGEKAVVVVVLGWWRVAPVDCDIMEGGVVGPGLKGVSSVRIGELPPVLPPPRFFFTAAIRQFMRALDVCSSKIDFFMFDPIWDTRA